MGLDRGLWRPRWLRRPRELLQIVGALTAPTFMALTCRVEEPSTASTPDISVHCANVERGQSRPNRSAANRKAVASPLPRLMFFVQAASACAFRFLRRASRPEPPTPVAKSGKAAGRGVTQFQASHYNTGLFPTSKRRCRSDTREAKVASSYVAETDTVFRRCNRKGGLSLHSSHRFRSGMIRWDAMSGLCSQSQRMRVQTCQGNIEIGRGCSRSRE